MSFAGPGFFQGGRLLSPGGNPSRKRSVGVVVLEGLPRPRGPHACLSAGSRGAGSSGWGRGLLACPAPGAPAWDRPGRWARRVCPTREALL